MKPQSSILFVALVCSSCARPLEGWKVDYLQQHGLRIGQPIGRVSRTIGNTNIGYTLSLKPVNWWEQANSCCTLIIDRSNQVYLKFNFFNCLYDLDRIDRDADIGSGK